MPPDFLGMGTRPEPLFESGGAMLRVALLSKGDGLFGGAPRSRQPAAQSWRQHLLRRASVRNHTQSRASACSHSNPLWLADGRSVCKIANASDYSRRLVRQIRDGVRLAHAISRRVRIRYGCRSLNGQ